MSKGINLSDELYERLEHQAGQQGQTIEDYLDQLTLRDPREHDLVRNRLRAGGLLVTWPGPQPAVTEHPPIIVRGAPLSQTVIEDRR
jgi:hypothetical protein